MKNLIHGPSLAFAYTQAGQENSFGWDAMRTGLTLQVALLAKESQAGDIQVLTLAEAGAWFRRHFPVTPPTAVVAMDDWKHENRKTVWYDSRFYRLNVLWEDNAFFIRDLHRFDEHMPSVTHDTALAAKSLSYDTLPVMDGARWSGREKAGMWPVMLAPDGGSSPLVPDGPPVVKELNRTDLSINQHLRGGGTFYIICTEAKITFAGVDGRGIPLRWAWDSVGGAGQNSYVQAVTPDHVAYRSQGVNYELGLAPDAGFSRQLDNGTIRLSAGQSGKLVMILDATTLETTAAKVAPAARTM
jgi:hypothetical protein